MKPQEAEKAVESIQQRNARVEADKAWEMSWTRRVLVALITYAVIGAYLAYLGIEKAWLHASVPALAYILSTLGLNLIKSIWIKKVYSHDHQ